MAGIPGAYAVVTSVDETRIFYENLLDNFQVWTATRAPTDAPAVWTGAHAVPDLAVPGRKVVPSFLSLDGCRLYATIIDDATKSSYLAVASR